MEVIWDESATNLWGGGGAKCLMLDKWEVPSYAIIPSLRANGWVQTGERRKLASFAPSKKVLSAPKVGGSIVGNSNSTKGGWVLNGTFLYIAYFFIWNPRLVQTYA
jgi:hypothetical protein